jgi:hypothetical protein
LSDAEITANEHSNYQTSRSTEQIIKIPRATPDPHYLIKDKVVIFMEEFQSNYSKYKVDFNSPRTIEVAKKAGITFKDCIKK